MLGAYSETECLLGGGGQKKKAKKTESKQQKTGIRGSTLCLPLVRLSHRLSYLTGQL